VILFELVGQNEQHPAYQELEISNGNRQYHFLNSIMVASLQVQRPFLSQYIIKALNFHAITCLHSNAGEYRPCPVHVGDYQPPEHYRVQGLMDDFVNQVNRHWDSIDPVLLTCFVLWRLNYIHPFINGNGRTARAAAYFVLCLKMGGPLPGTVILPELLRKYRDEYVVCLKHADQVRLADGNPDLGPLHQLVSRCLDEQLATANGRQDLQVSPNGASPETPPAAPPDGPAQA
jgi:hypothetical protein